MKKLAILAIAFMMIPTMAIGLAGCGESEEIEEITTTAQETQETETEEDTNEDGDESADYESVYNEYNAKMQEAAKEYLEELKSKSSSLSKSDLYDLTKEKTDALNDIRKEGNEKLMNITLANTEDDQSEYEKWYKKLSTSYSELSRDLTEVYTNAF